MKDSKFTFRVESDLDPTLLQNLREGWDNLMKNSPKTFKTPVFDSDISFTVNVKVTEQHIKDLLACALEGGANYWYSDLEVLTESENESFDRSDRFYNDLMNGFKLIDSTTNKTIVIHREKFGKALELMFVNHSRHYKDFISQNSDAITGDVFLQLLCFGDVIYG